jgi:L-serine dehydratase
MRAGREFCLQLKEQGLFEQTDGPKVGLFGSLRQTGKGHGTGKAVILGLQGLTPESIDINVVDAPLLKVNDKQTLDLNGEKAIDFDREGALVFHRRKTLPLHANGLIFHALSAKKIIVSQSYYSIGVAGGEGLFFEKNIFIRKNQRTATRHTASALSILFRRGITQSM